MTDVEKRLRDALTARAEQIDSSLTGAQVRRLAERHAQSRRRTGLQALAAAAVVAALAVGQQLLAGPSHHAPSREPAGGHPTVVAPSGRPATSPVSPSATRIPRPLRSSAPASTPAPRPTARVTTRSTTRPTTRPSTSPTALPSSGPTTSRRYVPPPPPRVGHPGATTTAPGA